jgi:uncharacterized protein YqfB (UPF0267 family)
MTMSLAKMITINEKTIPIQDEYDDKFAAAQRLAANKRERKNILKRKNIKINSKFEAQKSKVLEEELFALLICAFDFCLLNF